MNLDKDLAENYDQLCRERGWSYQTLADSVEPMNPQLAEHFRAKATDDPEPDPEPEARPGAGPDPAAPSAARKRPARKKA